MKDRIPTMKEHIDRLLAELETAKANNDKEAIVRIEWDLALAYHFND